MATKKKEKLEQVSHKVIEKKRRDRINNSLAELSQAVPAAFAKQSSGKLEKAEILEMTVEYLRAINALGQKLETVEWLNPLFHGELQRHYSEGYSECIREVLRYVTEVEGLNMNDTRCIRMMTYLQTRNVNLSDTIASHKKQANTTDTATTSTTSTECVPCSGNSNSMTANRDHRSHHFLLPSELETKASTPHMKCMAHDSQYFTCSYPLLKVFPPPPPPPPPHHLSPSSAEYLGLPIKANSATPMFHPNDLFHYNHFFTKNRLTCSLQNPFTNYGACLDTSK